MRYDVPGITKLKACASPVCFQEHPQHRFTTASCSQAKRSPLSALQEPRLYNVTSQGNVYLHCPSSSITPPLPTTPTMMFHPINSIALALTLTIQCTVGQVFTGPQDLRVETALTLDVPCNGVSTTPDGRLFLVLARVDGSKGPAVVEYNRTTNEMTAYPNEAWNSYQDGDDPSTKFVRINSQRVGPDGHLYVVDAGSPSFGEPVILPEGPKLIQINVNTNEVSRVYPMGNVTRYNSLLDDVRFNPATGKAHLTDAGSPGLIVLDLASRIREESLRQVRNMAQKGRPQCQQKGRIWFSLRTESISTSMPISLKYLQTARISTSRLRTVAFGNWRRSGWIRLSTILPSQAQSLLRTLSHTRSRLRLMALRLTRME